MKQTPETSPLITSGNIDPNASIMGMTSEAALEMTRHLRNTVYSDKILAVVREISLNLIDEHNVHNINKSGEIGIRKVDNDYEFFARDFALGLSEDGIRNVFGAYGNSSKKLTNLASGMLGIGSKAPFSYSDTYYVISHFQGEQTTYMLVLGGDSKGSSNGFIYKTHTEPTTERGLEVIVPVKFQDLIAFEERIKKFVHLSPYNIKATILDKEILPITPTWQKQIGDYNFRVLPCEDYHATGKIFYQMGGNSYESKKFLGENQEQIKDGYCLVVDVPIGHCSITLSRESFEKTEKNDKVLVAINNILNNLVESDLSQFKTKTVTDLINEKASGYNAFEGDIFSTLMKNLYSKSWSFVSNVLKHGETGFKLGKTNKPICVVVPDNQATSYWSSKIKEFFKNEGWAAYYITESRYWSRNDSAISDCFECINAKQLPYPKQPITKLNGVVWDGGKNIGRFTAMEFANHVRSIFKLEATHDVEEMKKWIAEKKQEAKREDQLNKFTIWSSARGWKITNNKLRSEVLSLGFMDAFDDEYRKLRDVIQETERKASEAATMCRQAIRKWAEISPRTIKASQKVKNAEKLVNFWNTVLKEQSLRGKILSTYQKAPYYEHEEIKLSRSELRHILKLTF